MNKLELPPALMLLLVSLLNLAIFGVSLAAIAYAVVWVYRKVKGA